MKSSTCTTIPTKSKEVNSFVGTSIQVMTPSDLAEVDALNNVLIKEPLFSVKEGDKTYIYSFKKISEAIDSEIYRISASFGFSLGLCICSLLGFAYLFFLATSVMPTFNIAVMSVSIASFAYGIYVLVMVKHRRYIRQLESKKEYVFTSSQNYLKQLREEAQKPVIVL